MKKLPKTQTFKLGKYHFDWIDSPIRGSCDVPDGYFKLRMMIPKITSEKELADVLHEVAHAEKIPDKYLDGKRDFTVHQAKLIWRLIGHLVEGK